MTTVVAHVAVAPEARDLAWLKQALQLAIEVENATLPLYLAATYSLRTQAYTAYNSLRSIAMEEMAHMASVCNMLAAIGGTPEIAQLAPRFPAKGLPGGAEPDLQCCIAKLSREQLKNFLRLETPSFLLAPEYSDEAYPTIGRLYDAIRRAIDGNQDAIRAAVRTGGTSNQVGDNIGFSTITAASGIDPVLQMRAALDAIVTQGEGTAARTLVAATASECEESHYCKFAALYYGRQYQRPANSAELTRDGEARFFDGLEIPFPDVVNVLAVPSDGYAKLLAADPNGAAVENSLAAFDDAYTGIMTNLHAVWNGPAAASWPTLGQSVAAMGKLRVLACFNIIRHEVPRSLVGKLQTLYPSEYQLLSTYTDLNAPVFYGPRFANLNAKVS
jgi:hypothetical protein